MRSLYKSRNGEYTDKLKSLCLKKEKEMKQGIKEGIMSERQERYGDPSVNMSTTGKMFTGMLEQHFGEPLPGFIPGYIVALMHVTIKVSRMCHRSPLHQDNYDDAHNYLEIARKLQEEFDEDAFHSSGDVELESKDIDTVSDREGASGPLEETALYKSVRNHRGGISITGMSPKLEVEGGPAEIWTGDMDEEEEETIDW